MGQFFHATSGLIEKNWTGSPIHTSEVDGAILPTVLLYSDSGDSSTVRIQLSALQPIGPCWTNFNSSMVNLSSESEIKIVVLDAALLKNLSRSQTWKKCLILNCHPTKQHHLKEIILLKNFQHPGHFQVCWMPMSWAVDRDF